MAIKKKSKPKLDKKLGMGKKRKLNVTGPRVGGNRVRSEPRSERPKARKIAKRGPTKTVN